MLAEIDGDESIDRGRPVSPDHIGYCRTLERERRFPPWLGRSRGDRFPRAFIDPASDQRDLAGGERRPAQRHRRRHLARDSLHQQTSRRVARAKSRTAAAAFESVGMRGERESPRASLGAVAAQAAIFEKGLPSLQSERTFRRVSEPGLIVRGIEDNNLADHA